MNNNSRPIQTIHFNDIRNRISESDKNDLLQNCYTLLDQTRERGFPIWNVLALMKWAYIFAGQRYPPKELTDRKVNKLMENIWNFSQDHISQFFQNKQIDRAFHILYNQQFYLQRKGSKDIFATQLKLFNSLRHKYDIDNSFFKLTGLSIRDFLFIEQILWLYIYVNKLKDVKIRFYGYLQNEFLDLVAEMTSRDKVNNFVSLMTLDPETAKSKISEFRLKINNSNLQTMEISVFTRFPFQLFQGKNKLIHKSVYDYATNYFIYDYLKTHDQNFTTELGPRLEKYVQAGLDEIQLSYTTESQLKRKLNANSTLVDFYIDEDKILIECKATELQPYPSVNPTDELIYNSLKSSFFKAYFEQMLPVAKSMNPDCISWGIIITYKEFFWCDYTELLKIGAPKYPNVGPYTELPASNVIIIDLYSWNKVIQIIKDGKATLLQILERVKTNNQNSETRKQLFDMHLDEYEIHELNLDYLADELNRLSIK